MVKTRKYVYAYHCAQLSDRIQHRTVLIIFPLIHQTIIIASCLILSVFVLKRDAKLQPINQPNIIAQMISTGGTARSYKGRSVNKLQKWYHSVNFQNMKNKKYTFCRKFNLGHMLKFLWVGTTSLFSNHLYLEDSQCSILLTSFLSQLAIW